MRIDRDREVTQEIRQPRSGWCQPKRVPASGQ